MKKTLEATSSMNLYYEPKILWATKTQQIKLAYT